MGLFDYFKKQEKTYICARCKKAITDEESTWIGNHRFCSDCAAPPKKVTIASKETFDTEPEDKTMETREDSNISNPATSENNDFPYKEKTYICARCKKEITAEETKWIGNHRFCTDCAAPLKSASLGFSTGNVEKNTTEYSSSMVRPSDVIYLEKEYAEKEIQQAKHLFTYESDYIDERDFSHYSMREYFLTFQKKILVKSSSWTIDIHSISNNSSSKRYFYLSFEYLNKHISNYNIPEANKYLGISEENCENFF